MLTDFLRALTGNLPTPARVTMGGLRAVTNWGVGRGSRPPGTATAYRSRLGASLPG